MVQMLELASVGSEAGVSDRTFSRRLRQLLRDIPKQANEQANGNGTSTFIQMTKVPIYDDSECEVFVAGVSVPVVQSPDLVTNKNCFVDFDNGGVIFGTPPPAGTNNVIFQHTQVRWPEGVLLQSLYGGLRQLFPALYKRELDTSITMQVNQWLYQLPPDFWDPRVRIISAAIQEVPPTVNRPIPLAGIYRQGLQYVQIPSSQRFTPGATLFLEYTAPYRSLSELEPQAYDLPLWYAAGQLLGFDESKRTRVDTQSPAAEQSANPPGYQQNTGAWYMTQFRTMLAQLASPPPMMPRAVSTYSF